MNVPQDDTLKRYVILREAGKTLFGKVVRELPEAVLVQVAKELRLWKGKSVVCDKEDLDVLSDRLFHDKKWDGKDAVEHYIAQRGESALTDDERTFHKAMKKSRYSLYLLKEIRDRFLLFNDMLRADQVEIRVVDINLSKTARPNTFFATRLLDFGDFMITSGVGFPFDRAWERHILDYLKGKEPYSSRKRWDRPGDYPVYFFRLHGRFGDGISFAEYDEWEE